MAIFAKAFENTMGHEGGYSFDPVDVGGETYKGIARRYHPSWDGWKIIDEAKKEMEAGSPDFEAFLASNKDLQRSIEQLYKQLYWDRFWGDVITNQEIATELFDTAVNMGVGRAVEFLQASINLLSRNLDYVRPLVEDGAFGPKTADALESVLIYNSNKPVLTLLNIHQGNHYVNYMLRKPEQKRFAVGWIKRVNLLIGKVSGFSDRFRKDIAEVEFSVAKVVAEIDTAISMNFSNRSIQGSLNLLNRNRPNVYWEELVIDGKIGPKTIKTLRKCCERDTDALNKMLCILVGRRFVNVCLKNPQTDIVEELKKFFAI